MVASRDPEVEEPGPDAALRRRRRRHRRAHAQGARRLAARARAGRRSGCGSPAGPRPSPYLVAEVEELPDVVDDGPELEALARNVQQTFSRIIEQVPYLPEELQMAVANLEDPCALSHLIAGSLRIPTEERQSLLEEVDVAKRLRRLSEILARELEVARYRHQDPDAGPVRDGPDPARVHPAPAAQGDPGGARRARPGRGGGRRAARAARRARAARGRAQAGRPRALAAGEAPAGLRRARRDPHLAGVDRLAAVEHVDRGQPRPRARAQGARRRPLRHRDDQGPHPRVPRRAQAHARRGRQLDPVLRRPARRRQDLARAARSRARWAASSSASAPAACATRPRSAATAAPTSAPCPGRSSARCATRAPRTPCS